MINFIHLVGILIIANALHSCESNEEKKAEIVTNNYIRFIDSVTTSGTNDALTNWNTIQKCYEKKSNDLNLQIDLLEDNTIFDEKINAATSKYETFRSLIMEKKLKQEAGSF
ncbi:hypothetical protein [Flavobacterium xanthum]|uniref:DUF4296 domain-containing protein n=1 Tax=Flavobacterium xanthum TaxID=69322 RepID=A0A1M7G6W7_9FLAO|nr:hypothetical protein [Flavobacterium xanthum]SHM12132.1 hypothetical protein SAMN05443669_102254 [Flavobacterium xanthum]